MTTNTTKPRAALYARVSTAGQRDQGISLQDQLARMREYAEQQGWEVYDEFVDTGSGRSERRPQFQRLNSLGVSENPPFRIILVWELSRFSRNRYHSIMYKHALEKRGIRVHSVTQSIGKESATSRMVEGVSEIMDQFESELNSPRTSSRMRALAESGHWVNGQAPYGYVKQVVRQGHAKRHRLALDEETAPIVGRIFRWCAQDDVGFLEIAQRLNDEGIRNSQGNKWSKNNISTLLANENYTGTMIFGYGRKVDSGADSPAPVRVPDAHPAIVDKALFDLARRKVKDRSPGAAIPPAAMASRFLLSGFTHCALCGSAMVGATAHNWQGKKYDYYRCSQAMKQGARSCGHKAVRKEHLEGTVVARIRTHVLTDQNVRELVRMVNARIELSTKEDLQHRTRIAREMSRIQAAIKNLWRPLESGEAIQAAPILAKIEEKEEERTQLQNELEQIDAGEFSTVPEAEVLEQVKGLKSLLAESGFMASKRVLRRFVESVAVDLDTITIDYGFPIEPGGSEVEAVVICDHHAPEVGQSANSWLGAFWDEVAAGDVFVVEIPD